MSQVLAETLFESETRSKVLGLLFVERLEASVSELARRAQLSTRAVAREVNHLLPTGLLRVETVRGADVVRANPRHPAASHLRALLSTPAVPDVDESQGWEVRESLASWGAPLAGVEARRRASVNESLLRGLEEARRDGTVLRVLPSVLAKHWESLDWRKLTAEARRRKLKAELGFLVELTARLLGNEELAAHAEALHDERRKTLRFFPEAKSRFEEDLARQRSTPLAKRWGFWMNLSEESFRSTLDRHRA